MADRKLKVNPSGTVPNGVYVPEVVLVNSAGAPVGTLAGTAPTVANAAGATPTKAEFDALLAALRTRGVLAP